MSKRNTKKFGNVVINPQEQYNNNIFTVAEIVALKNILARGQSDAENNFLTEVKDKKDINNKFAIFKNMFPYILTTLDLLTSKVSRKVVKKGGMDPIDDLPKRQSKQPERYSPELPVRMHGKNKEAELEELNYVKNLKMNGPNISLPSRRQPNVFENDDTPFEFGSLYGENDDFNDNNPIAPEKKKVGKPKTEKVEKPKTEPKKRGPKPKTATVDEEYPTEKVTVIRKSIEDELYDITQKLYKLVQEADTYFLGNILPDISSISAVDVNKLQQFVNTLKVKYNNLITSIPKSFKSEQSELIKTLFTEFFQNLNYGLSINTSQLGGSINNNNNSNKLAEMRKVLNRNPNVVIPHRKYKQSDFTSFQAPTKPFFSNDLFKTNDIFHEFPPNSFKPLLFKQASNQGLFSED